jgi:hypothetical protein
VSALTFGVNRADEGNRTPNRLFTKQVLCQLSYVSQKEAEPRQTRMIEGKLGLVNGVDHVEWPILNVTDPRGSILGLGAGSATPAAIAGVWGYWRGVTLGQGHVGRQKL